MSRYHVSITVISTVVWAGEVEAETPSHAREQAAYQFWGSDADLERDLPKMDQDNATSARKMIARIKLLHECALAHGVQIHCRKSRAKA